MSRRRHRGAAGLIGFSIAFLAEIVSDGYANASEAMMRAGRQPVNVVRMKITPAGRKAVEGPLLDATRGGHWRPLVSFLNLQADVLKRNALDFRRPGLTCTHRHR
jgi:hypothetical protein